MKLPRLESKWIMCVPVQLEPASAHRARGQVVAGRLWRSFSARGISANYCQDTQVFLRQAGITDRFYVKYPSFECQKLLQNMRFMGFVPFLKEELSELHCFPVAQG